MLASEFGPRARYEDFRKLVQQYLNSQRRRSYVRFPRVQTLTALRCYDPHEDGCLVLRSLSEHACKVGAEGMSPLSALPLQASGVQIGAKNGADA